MLVSSVVDHGFKPRSGQTKDHKIGIYCYSCKRAASRSKRKEWLVWNHDNVSKWSDMSTRELLCQWANTIKNLYSVFVCHHYFTECNLFSAYHSWKFAYFVLNDNHSLAHLNCYSSFWCVTNKFLHYILKRRWGGAIKDLISIRHGK
jgi:hypothetical protein